MNKDLTILYTQLLRHLKDNNFYNYSTRLGMADIFQSLPQMTFKRFIEKVKDLHIRSYSQILKSSIDFDNFIYITHKQDKPVVIKQPHLDNDWDTFLNWTKQEGLTFCSGAPIHKRWYDLNVNYIYYIIYWPKGFRYGAKDSYDEMTSNEHMICTCQEFMNAYETNKQQIIEGFALQLRN